MNNNTLINFMNIPVIDNPERNSPYEIIQRAGIPRIIEKSITETNGSFSINIAQINGTVRVIDNCIVIKEANSISNMTDVYLDVYDGTVSVPLTNDVDMSGSSIGTFLTKDKGASESLSINKADQVRLLEPDADSLCKAFWITQKYGVDTFLRFNFSTTGTVDIVLEFGFLYCQIDSGEFSLL